MAIDKTIPQEVIKGIYKSFHYQIRSLYNDNLFFDIRKGLVVAKLLLKHNKITKKEYEILEKEIEEFKKDPDYEKCINYANIIGQIRVQEKNIQFIDKLFKVISEKCRNKEKTFDIDIANENDIKQKIANNTLSIKSNLSIQITKLLL